jgi:hypothetical protein
MAAASVTGRGWRVGRARDDGDVVLVAVAFAEEHVLRADERRAHGRDHGRRGAALEAALGS